MPLTEFQSKIVKLLSSNRNEESYLAGGAALNIKPNSHRFSNDLDYFQDSILRVSQAFELDYRTLIDHGYCVDTVMKTPGFVRSVVSANKESTKVEWVHDTAWRFLPVVRDELAGFVLHPIDVALNKVLALAGRDEPRDYLDVVEIHLSLLPLGSLIWAAAGKDPGFTPFSLLELLKRKGRYRQEDFQRLHLNKVVEVTELKVVWLAALGSAEKLITRLPKEEVGCLYYSPITKKFVSPDHDSKETIPHYGKPGGVLPIVEQL